MSVRVRLAPSPTGNLHIGTARTAVFNWLFARGRGGQFILRIEDTDRERSRPEYTQNILDGLQWLGLDWDEGPFFQSERMDLYARTIQTLLDKELAYRCYCTPEELETMRAEQKERGQAPRYDNRHRHLTEAQRNAFEAEGRTAVIRFKIEDDRPIVWKDLVRGDVRWQGSDLGGDMAIARAAGPGEIGQPLYNLAVVADDLDMRMTHVIRGEDHIANTAKQILLYEALGATLPEFAHTPLILNAQGQKLSKRDGAVSVDDFRKLGFVAPALANYMTLLGWSPPNEKELFLLSEAAELFDFDRVNKAGGKFDWDRLDWIDSQYLHALPPAELLELLAPLWREAGYAFDLEGDRPWLLELAALVGPSLTRLSEATDMSRIFFQEETVFDEKGKGQMAREEAIAIAEAVRAKIVERSPLSAETAGTIVKEIVKDQKVKKGVVMKTLRAALTGSLQGPDLMQSWSILNQRGWDVPRLERAIVTGRES